VILVQNPILAEVSDKLPRVSDLWVAGIVLAAIAVCICRYFKSALLVCVPLALLWSIAVSHEFLGDDLFATAVVEELGIGYLIQVVLANLLLFLSLFVMCFLVNRQRHQMEHEVTGSEA
jgi:uncharacterized membrane protein